LLALLIAAGCNSGETPTPVPSNTPTPSAQDGQPIRDNEPEPSSESPATDDQASTNKNPPTETPVTSSTPDEPLEQPEPSAPTATTSPAAPTSADAAQLVEKLAVADERDAVTRQIVAQGAAAVEPLVAALQNDSLEIRASAVFCLSQLGKDARPALPQLKEVAENDKAPAVRDAAAFAIDAIERTQ
jgi:hypothetical protein